ncbi:MAG: tyrosine/phenylalanine carboxypeptidase domain-containing protein [Patescibacteria group bacterium]
MKFLRDHGILGINARNLEYLRPFNSKKAVRLADSKLKTKHFLSTRGIPVPKLLATIRTRSELEKFDFGTLPESFVLKPDAGYGGEGIIVVKGKVLEGVWEKVGGGEVTEDDLREHIDDILDGQFSIASLPDTAFFESRVNSVEYIPGLKVEGLPDIRVIVHNLIPVMAMLRVPTPESGGKANVHLGGLGIGIDLMSGKTTHATQYNKLLGELPGGIPTAGHEIPHFDEILRIASESQIHTNLGYLAADLVLDQKEGPVLLEVNARAGLMVQVANLAPLKKRLERVKGLKVDSPEKGVKLGKDLFGKVKKQKKKYPKKKVVDYVEPVEILLKEGSRRAKVELDPTHETTAIDHELAERLGLKRVGESAKQVHLKIILAGERITTVAEKENLSKADYKIILGRRDLTNFLINPDSKETEKQALPKEAKPPELRINYKAIDKRLMAIDKRIHLLYYLKPTNLLFEKKKFFAEKKSNPIFRYPRLRFNVGKMRGELSVVKTPDTPLGQIFQNKKTEISRKLDLLESIGTPALSGASQKLYGFPGREVSNIARDILKDKPRKFAEEQATIDAQAATEEFKKAFKQYGIRGWRFVFKDDLVADALANKRKVLFIRSMAKWSPERLRSTIAHEVETHILRAENGRQQKYEIFERGFGGYLETEEGLAIYNQQLVLKEPHEKQYWPVLSLLAVDYAAMHSFREVFDFVKKHGFDDERAWKTALKVKRGLADTAAPGGFSKEHLYFSGLSKITKFVDEGGDLAKLYVGKIRVEDVDVVSGLSEVRPAKKLPAFY